MLASCPPGSGASGAPTAAVPHDGPEPLWHIRRPVAQARTHRGIRGLARFLLAPGRGALTWGRCGRTVAMSESIYLGRDGWQLGPYGWAQIAAMVSAGQVRPGDLAWHD